MADHASGGRIDVHVHYVPEAYRRVAVDAGLAHPDGTAGYPDWSAEAALEVMDRQGIQSAVISLSSPGVYWGDDAGAIRLARLVNEEGARVRDAHSDRFGVFASLPLPNVEASLAEIEHAFDTLHVDGVVLLTNIAGTYLGDPSFDALFAELNRRRAIVFLHPTSPPCWEAFSLGLPRPLMEFPFDTTRAVTNLFRSGTLDRCHDLRVIVPHAGGALPFLVHRLARAREEGSAFADVLATLHYDLAGSTDRAHLVCLRELVDVDRMLYGSDWPWTPESRVEAGARLLDANGVLGVAERAMVYRGNALKLFPRFSPAGDASRTR